LLRKQLVIGEGNWANFVTRPIFLVILILSVLGFLYPFLMKQKQKA